jgi:hypothetical protein
LRAKKLLVKVCYLIRTNALDSDERFNKTCAFLSGVGNVVQVFAVVKRVSMGLQDTWIQQRLYLRRLLGSGHLVVLKYIELLLRAAWFLTTHRGRRWYANFDFLPLHVLTVMLTPRHMRPIWDLHEMPPDFVIRNAILRRVVAYVLTRSHVIVCNEARRDALEGMFGIRLQDALVLRNYPARSALEALLQERRAYLDSPEAEDDRYRIVITGGNVPGRCVRESVKVIASLREKTGLPLEVTIVGGAPLDYPGDFVTSTGFIPFTELIRRCVAGGISLCFYRTNSLNNRLCEPNRFYQAMVVGQHVLTFDHPSLNELQYANHHIVDESDFARSLEAKLLSLLTGTTGPRDRPGETVRARGQRMLEFESQLPAFGRWYPQ